MNLILQANLKPSCSVLLVAAASLCCMACGQIQEPNYQVSGTVLFNGKPAEGAVVVLHPTGDNKALTAHPQGTAGADGSFQLTTFEPNDGAPSGNYDVTVTWTKLLRPDEKDEVSRLPARYGRPQSSGLHAQVKPEAKNTLAPFELKP